MKKLFQHVDQLGLTVAATLISTVPWLSVLSGVRAYCSLALVVVAGTFLGFGSHKYKKIGSPILAVLMLLLILDCVTIGNPFAPGLILKGLVSGFARISTSVLPISVPGWLLVSPVTLVALSAWLAGRIQRYSPFSLLATLPWIVSFSVSTAFGSQNNGATPTNGMLLTSALLVWAMRRNEKNRIYVDRVLDRTIWQKIRLGLAPIITLSVLALALVGVQVSAGIAGGRPIAINRILPDHSLDGSNPSIVLATLRYSSPSLGLYRLDLTKNAIRSGWRISTAKGRSEILLPIATLTNYDGNQWTLGNLIPVNGGNAIPLMQRVNKWRPTNIQQNADIKIELLKGVVQSGLGRFIPSPGGVLTSVGPIEANVDPASGFGVSASPMVAGTKLYISGTSDGIDPPGTSGSGWNLSPKVCSELLAYAGVKSSKGTCPDAEVSVSTAIKIMTAVVSNLRQTYGVAPLGRTSASENIDRIGQSYGDIMSTIFGSQHMGTPEQYATLVALLARSIGLNSRIETGFLVPATSGVQTVEAGESYAWAEVYLGNRWVVENATPLKVGIGAPQTASVSVPSQSSTSNGGDCLTSGCKVIVKNVPEHVKTSIFSSHFGKILLLSFEIVGALLLVLLPWALVVGLLKRRRRNRRLRGSPVHIIRGCLLELLDFRRELLQHPLPSSETTSEIMHIVAGEISSRTAAEESDLIGAVNVAFYSSTETGMLPSAQVLNWLTETMSIYKKNASYKSRLLNLFRYSKIAR